MGDDDSLPCRCFSLVTLNLVLRTHWYQADEGEEGNLAMAAFIQYNIESVEGLRNLLLRRCIFNNSRFIRWREEDLSCSGGFYKVTISVSRELGHVCDEHYQSNVLIRGTRGLWSLS